MLLAAAVTAASPNKNYYLRRTVTDVEVNTLGVIIAGVSVISSGMQQILCGTIQRKHKMSSHQLLSNTAGVQVRLLQLAYSCQFWLCCSHLEPQSNGFCSLTPALPEPSQGACACSSTPPGIPHTLSLSKPNQEAASSGQGVAPVCCRA